MRKNESKILIEMLPDYYRHMENNQDSLITRFYGVYGVKQVHGRTVSVILYFVWFSAFICCTFDEAFIARC
jgi:1-phosphatidylinositol-4-phosphate 5-kinase